jgi:hypothetical protein
MMGIDEEATLATLSAYRAVSDMLIEKRAGSVRLNSFRVSISVVLPGLRCFLPHWGWDGGRA